MYIGRDGSDVIFSRNGSSVAPTSFIKNPPSSSDFRCRLSHILSFHMLLLSHSRVHLFVTRGLQHASLPCFSPSSQSLFKLKSIGSVMPSNISSSAVPLPYVIESISGLSYSIGLPIY